MAGKILKQMSHKKTGHYNPKIFVLDTNIILHDHRCIFNFQEHDIYIPITVIEELDKFKKGNDTINYNAREFIRDIDRLTNSTLFEQGTPLGKGKGHIKIEMGHPFTQLIKDSLSDDIPDHRIIATTMWLQKDNSTRKVILVTKDMNLRLKAKALGLTTQDYLTDMIKEEKVERTRKEVHTLKDVSDSTIESLTSKDSISLKELGIQRTPSANKLYKILDKHKHIILARFNKQTNSVVQVKERGAFGINAKNREQIFALDAILNPEIKLVSLTGTAGTGKTLLALAGALAQSNNFSQILLARPVIPLKNQEVGFLPGKINEKIGPYMLPLFDNLNVIKNSFKPNSAEILQIEDMLKTEKLLITPLAFIRGRSINNVFFIIDEAQNLTPHEVKTIITRAGEGTKIIFTGDMFQIDQPYLDIHSNGLAHLGEKFHGQPVFEHVNLVKGERSQLSELAGKLL